MFDTGIFFKNSVKEKEYDKNLPEDTLLAFRAAEGDEEAFETLVRKYERLVSSCIYQTVSNTEDTLDIAQETFLKVYKSLSTFKGESSFSSWIYRVAKNCALDFLRKKKPVSMSLDSTDEEGATIDVPDTDAKSNPEDMLLKNEAAVVLYEAMKKLSDEHREMITLRDLNGFTYEEIAQSLGLEAGTVKSRLFRARESLRKILLKENYF